MSECVVGHHLAAGRYVHGRGVSMGPMEPQRSCQNSMPNFGNTVRVECNAGKLRQKASLMTWTSTLSSKTVDLG